MDNQFNIGDIVSCQKGFEYKAVGGLNTYVDTPQAIISIAGAVFKTELGGWCYHDAFNPSILYQEENITLL